MERVSCGFDGPRDEGCDDAADDAAAADGDDARASVYVCVCVC